MILITTCRIPVMWQAFAVKCGTFASAAGALVLISLAEVAHLVLPRYTPDVRGVLAGIVGVGFAVPVLLWRTQRIA